MTKFQPNRQTLRTKKQIANDFERYLIDSKIISISEEGALTEQQLLDLLEEMLYETIVVDGVECSSDRAWELWIKVVLKENPATKQLIWNSFVKDAFQDVERHRYTAILASRGLGKSWFVYALYSLFKMYLFEYTKILITSNVPTMCKRNLREAKRMIDSNELLISKKGIHKKRELLWAQDKFEYNEGILETASVGSNIRSAHVNYVFIDDVLRDDGKYSDEEVNNFIFGQLFPTAQRFKARFIITGTPMHIRDLYHDVMNTHANFMGNRIGNGAYSYRGFWCREYRIIKDWDKKEVYLPEMATWWSLADDNNPQSAINVQGQAKFMREYMLVCTDESTSLFPEKLIAKCSSQPYQYLYMAEHDEKSPPKNYVLGVDVATAGEASSDNSAFIVIEIIPTEKGSRKVVRHITTVKGMAISEQINTIREISNSFNGCYTVVEKNNVGVALIQELQKLNVPVDEFTTTRASKENMIRYLISEMTNGNFFFCEDTPEIRDLKKELMNFGVVRNKQTGKERIGALSGHDDRVIALAIANYAATYMTQVPFIYGENVYER